MFAPGLVRFFVSRFVIELRLVTVGGTQNLGIGIRLAAGIAVSGDVGCSTTSGDGLPILPFLGVDAR